MSTPEPPRAPSPPEPPTASPSETPGAPKRSWWQRGWGIAVIAVVGAIIGAAIGASGNGSTKTVTTEAAPRTVQVAQAPTHTVTVTHVVVHTHTHTVTAPAPESPSEASSGSGSSGGGSSGGGGSYSGNGTKNLGTLTISEPSTLRWHATEGFFGVDGATSSYEHTIAISSKASSGESAIEPGTYHEVNVLAEGEWSFTITPG